MYLIENRCSSTSHSSLRREREISRKQSLKSWKTDKNSLKSRSERILITKTNDASIITLTHITLRIAVQNMWKTKSLTKSTSQKKINQNITSHSCSENWNDVTNSLTDLWHWSSRFHWSHQSESFDQFRDRVKFYQLNLNYLTWLISFQYSIQDNQDLK